MKKGIHALYEGEGAALVGQYAVLTGLTTLALYHSFARSPDLVLLQYVNLVTDNGYNPGDEVCSTGNPGSNAASGIAIWCRPGIITTSDFSANTQYLHLKTSGAAFALVQARWKVRLKAHWFASLGKI